jgi:hypothetical protein
MKKLISMTDFVLKQNNKSDSMGCSYWKCNNYANLLKQPRELWMFVPCDEDGNVLEEPLKRDYNNVNINNSYYKKYQQAKERCLFEGFELLGNKCVLNRYFMIHFLNGEISIEEHFEEIVTKLGKQVKTIEDLIPYNLTLTASAQKQIS